MLLSEIKRIAKRYAEKLKKENFPYHSIYLFGSFRKNYAHKWSDIDIAVISDRFKRNSEKNSLLLWTYRDEVDDRIEPHGFTIKDFEYLNDPMVYEIRTTGIRIL